MTLSKLRHLTPRFPQDCSHWCVPYTVEAVGCWWHGCPEHYRRPKSNAGWWAQKIARNRERDQDTRERLEAIGWHLAVVWEHEDLDEAAD